MIQSIQESLKRKVAHSEEVVSKELHTEEKSIEVLYINTISDEKIFQEYVVVPFFEITSPERFLDYLQSQPKIKPFENEQKTLDELVRGVSILFYQDFIFY